MPQDLLPMFEAMKLLKEWSQMLVVAQTGMITAIAAFVQSPSSLRSRRWLWTSLLCFGVSIIVALNVVGTIPWLTQQLPNLAQHGGDIYQFRNWLGIKVYVLATGQHLSFVAGLACFLVFLMTRTPTDDLQKRKAK